MTEALIEHAGNAPTQDSAISRMIDYAMQQNADIEKLERLFALKVAYEKDEARKAYVAAMVKFKENPPEIFKNKHVSFPTSKGKTEYDHATIGDVTTITGAALSACGLSHRWNMTQGDGGRITVTCLLTHALGHTESVTLAASPDDSGGKNSIQALASTVTYLQRYTLLAAAGLATKDQPDDDGEGTSKREERKRSNITQERKRVLGDTAAEIVDLIGKDDDFGAFGLCEPITDVDEKEYLWTLLPSNARSAIKLMAENKRKQGESAQQQEGMKA